MPGVMFSQPQPPTLPELSIIVIMTVIEDEGIKICALSFGPRRNLNSVGDYGSSVGVVWRVSPILKMGFLFTTEFKFRRGL